MCQFGIYGDGCYRLQPVHVDNLAAVAVRTNETVDAIGPESECLAGSLEMGSTGAMRSGVLLGCEAATTSRALALSARHEGHSQFLLPGAQKVRELCPLPPRSSSSFLVFW